MSDHVTLSLRATLTESIQIDCVMPHAFAAMSEPEIATSPVRAGRTRRSLVDYFDIHGARSPFVRIVGDVRLANGIGAGMLGGTVMIDGNVGSGVGARMAGGTIDVRGNAGDDVGVAMRGGSIRVRGNAGDRVGAGEPGASRGVTGGEIVVDGTVGTDTGARMRRGLIFVGGNAGAHVARSIIAGSVIVLGQVGVEPAFGSKRGTLIVAGGVNVPVTYRHACDYEPPHVRLALTYLARRHVLTIDRSVIDGRYRRYCGDAGTVGRGEILELIR